VRYIETTELAAPKGNPDFYPFVSPSTSKDGGGTGVTPGELRPDSVKKLASRGHQKRGGGGKKVTGANRGKGPLDLSLERCSYSVSSPIPGCILLYAKKVGGGQKDEIRTGWS